MDKAKEISKDYADQHTCYANDPKLQYLYTRKAVEFGYNQAEKDLEMDWDDVSVLNCLLNEVEQEFKKGMHEDKTYIGYCKEVLKRFKDFKERKGK